MAYISLRGTVRDKKKTDIDEKADLQKKQIKAGLSHPIRNKILRILETGEVFTQHEIGSKLSISNASIHYHINKLLQVQLVRLESTRSGPNGIIEKLFKIVELDWLEIKNKKIEDFNIELSYAMAWINERLREGTNILKQQPEKATFLTNSFVVYTSPEEFLEFKEAVQAISQKFFEKHSKSKNKNAIPVSVSLALIPSHGEDADDSHITFE
ncbi:MAG: hypothetical protein COB67_06025 [SAR324 cluster bacterium]|uniref:HTH arsR-type domain-containing protein n=1 Tax=SAR324 cluster bacterium TaxID=2024889 RepID=A0A2A4T6H1_9DELT|nr:MAG: hypothetical protein COB67_06025 [SAR324 cluster bacterium]